MSMRSDSDSVLRRSYRQGAGSNHTIADGVGKVAEPHGVSRAKVALAWVRLQGAVTAPIIGVTEPGHLADALDSLDLELDDDLELIESPYTPRYSEGH
ncbi:aldo/keto reductase [Rhodococcus sp. D2-41]|uniref:Aldo/keto reductase n=1 Tax=Speluncibacter jeojiensis TaxID=2710754 RepID=A0A9X4M4K3_9ACTN|nr:aldo/keto reductase [Rhodococcus sp. D2-41]MDG3009328.1 aldo/keto reductase [Rhodococcus sp. D2-41]MDG3016885.1 aldo/keto reductase [Corynebacteriales bacterium D3-21]